MSAFPSVSSGIARGTPEFRRTIVAMLFGIGFAALGTIVVIFNYVGFRLMAPPYEMGQTAVGFLFLLYLAGVWSSGWTGSLLSHVGRAAVLRATMLITIAGALLTLPGRVPVIVVGVALTTIGFFGVHSVASSWVAVQARRGRAQGSSLYLAFYYLGSSVAGWLGGIFWDRGGWHGVIGFVVALMGTALLVARPLARAAPTGVADSGAHAGG